MRTDHLADDECVVVCRVCGSKLHHDYRRPGEDAIKGAPCPTIDECEKIRKRQDIERKKAWWRHQ